MKDGDLAAYFPRLWHMAEDGSWPSLRERGLLSTLALLDLHGVQGAERQTILSSRRPASVRLAREGLPVAIVRDQKPMNDGALRRCLLDGLEPADWYRLLNGKTFFWLDRQRLLRLFAARTYRCRPHLVIEVGTAGILARHGERVSLCPINSGATLYVPQPRGRRTFLPVAQYPYDPTGTRSSRGRPPVEFVVDYAVPDLAAHVVRVERHREGMVEVLWDRGDEATTPR